MPLVMLKKNWQNATFRRALRDGAGNVTGELIFPRGEPVEVPPEHLRVIAGDLGKALVPIELDERGRVRPVTLTDNDRAELQAIAEGRELPPAEASEKVTDPPPADPVPETPTPAEPVPEIGELLNKPKRK